jgi:hypothetical protein
MPASSSLRRALPVVSKHEQVRDGPLFLAEILIWLAVGSQYARCSALQ